MGDSLCWNISFNFSYEACKSLNLFLCLLSADPREYLHLFIICFCGLFEEFFIIPLVKFFIDNCLFYSKAI